VDTQHTYLARPFLKWAGGKSQLLSQFRLHYPPELETGAINRYVEPFLGGGAVFLDVIQNYPISESYLFDINEELILAYSVVQRAPQMLIEALTSLRAYYLLQDENGRLNYFYAIREQYNLQRQTINFEVFSDVWIERAAYMIFLNKTCFNGLYRVNASGSFNVPFGRYVNPVVFEEQNILRISELLKTATLRIGRFQDCGQYITDSSFVYFDPPYRPISKTSSFTSYARDKFNDNNQRELADFFRKVSRSTRAKMMLSNSDPTNIDPTDTFFDDLYEPFNIYQVSASRMINSVADGRGRINEILVTNYDRPTRDQE
jgi:DNA adenine methylase